jgi:uncharacterized membrane protein
MRRIHRGIPVQLGEFDWKKTVLEAGLAAVTTAVVTYIVMKHFLKRKKAEKIA